jgi:hypothetical protein
VSEELSADHLSFLVCSALQGFSSFNTLGQSGLLPPQPCPVSSFYSLKKISNTKQKL